eukprot:5279533-Pleurochrysis_carterae.AAC.2
MWCRAGLVGGWRRIDDIVTVLTGFAFALQSSGAHATLRLAPVVPHVAEDNTSLPVFKEVVVVALRPNILVRHKRANRSVL